MNYLCTYFKIIKKALSENRKKGIIYYEKHHIRPRSFGGSNKKINLVLLTAREHFICHALLAFYFNKNKKHSISSKRAFYMMSFENPLQTRYMNSRLFELNKIKLYGENGLQRGKGSPRFGVKLSDETKRKQSLSRKKMFENNPDELKRVKDIGKNKTKEHLEKIAKSNKGKKRTIEQRKNISEAHMGINQGSKNPLSKPCIVNGKIYESVSMAEKDNPEIKCLRYKIKHERYIEYQLIKDNENEQ
jgi:hypothetical protein